MKIRVTTHSGEDNTIEVLEYDPVQVTALRNDDSVHAIQLGDVSYSRIDIKTIMPVTEITSEV